MKTSKENKNKQHDTKPLKDKTIKTYMNKKS